MAGKKPPASSSKGGASKGTRPAHAPSRNPKSRSHQQPTAQTTTERNESTEDLKRQQVLLDIFSSAFRDVLGAEDFGSRLQELKTALFNRDFEGAFSDEAALDVYAARWSPTRALCYARVLRELSRYLEDLVGYEAPTRTDGSRRCDGEKNNDSDDGDEDGAAVDPRLGQEGAPKTTTTTTTSNGETQQKGEEEQKRRPSLRVLAIGGAAAEIVAFADCLSSSFSSSSPSIPPPPTPTTTAEITLLDIGPWASVIQKLHRSLTTPPAPASRYVNPSTQASALKQGPLITPSTFHTTFLQRDILSLSLDDLAGLISRREASTDDTGTKPPMLITLLFTLNELYTAGGLKRTTALLRSFSALASPGTLLLVVDSPGSYAEAAVGKEARRYPMQWLLDHTLVPPQPSRQKQKKTQDSTGDKDRGGASVEVGNSLSVEEEEGEEETGVKWERLESHDSIWLRVAEGLRYPIPLENMRYQMHLYRAYSA